MIRFLFEHSPPRCSSKATVINFTDPKSACFLSSPKALGCFLKGYLQRFQRKANISDQCPKKGSSPAIYKMPSSYTFAKHCISLGAKLRRLCKKTAIILRINSTNIFLPFIFNRIQLYNLSKPSTLNHVFSNNKAKLNHLTAFSQSQCCSC